jgi:hypothetical protein
MKRQRPSIRTARLSLPRAAVVLLALVAFALQSFVTQTHLHFAHAGDVAAFGPSFGGIGAAKAGQTRAKLPAKNESGHCAFCEEMWLAGAYVTPAAAFLILPQATVSIVEIISAPRVHVQTVSHDWRGRAPPRL